jgi:hypothetical protein
MCAAARLCYMCKHWHRNASDAVQLRDPMTALTITPPVRYRHARRRVSIPFSAVKTLITMLFILPDASRCGALWRVSQPYCALTQSYMQYCNHENSAKVVVCTFVRLRICNNFVCVVAHLSGAPVKQNVAAGCMCLEASYQVPCASSQYWMGTNNVQNMVMNNST